MTHMQDLHNQAAEDGKPGYVQLTSGNYLEDAALVKAETKFLRKIRGTPDHQITVMWEEAKPNEDGLPEFQMVCSCGTNQPYWDWGLNLPNLDGSIGERYIKIANRHILAEKLEAERELRADEEPCLIAKVHMIRVTHEWWVFHYTSDLADEISQTWANSRWPWCIAVKKSNGWRLLLVEMTKTQAIARGMRRLEKERFKGNGVELFEIDSKIGLEAPSATISSSVRRLIDDAKGLKPTATPHEIKVILQATDDGMTQLKLLEVLRTDLQRRFDESLDLT